MTSATRYYKRHDFNAECDLCGFVYKGSELRLQYDGLEVCRKCFVRRHPQEYLRGVPEIQPLPWIRPPSPDRFIEYNLLEFPTPLPVIPTPAPGPSPVVIGPVGVFSLNINLSGAENAYPSWPSMAEMAYWVGKGVRGFRIPLHWEDMQPTLGGSLDTTSTSYSGPNTANVSYMSCVSQCLANAANLGATVLLDVHNSGRYNGLRIGENGRSYSSTIHRLY